MARWLRKKVQQGVAAAKGLFKPQATTATPPAQGNVAPPPMGELPEETFRFVQQWIPRYRQEAGLTEAEAYQRAYQDYQQLHPPAPAPAPATGALPAAPVAPVAPGAPVVQPAQAQGVPSGHMVLTEQQLNALGAAGQGIPPDAQGRRVVPVDWYLNEKALARGQTVSAPGIQPAAGEPSAELTEGEAVRQRAYGERRLEMEQPYGALLSTQRIPEGGTERGKAIRKMAEERGIGIGEASKIYDSERREAARAERNRTKEIRRIARKERITYAEAAARYDSGQRAAAPPGAATSLSVEGMELGTEGVQVTPEERQQFEDEIEPLVQEWETGHTASGELSERTSTEIEGEIRSVAQKYAEPKTPRQAVERQLSTFAQPLQTGQMTYSDAALQLDPTAAAGERADDPVVGRIIKQIDHLRGAIIDGSASPEEAYRQITRLMRQIASNEPFEEGVTEQEALASLQDFDMADWVPAGQLEAGDVERVNAAVQQINERVAAGKMTGREGWKRVEDLRDTFARMKPTEPTEPAEPAEPQKLNTQIVGMLEGALGLEADEAGDYPETSIFAGGRTDESVGQALQERYDDFMATMTGAGYAPEAAKWHWDAVMYRHGLTATWRKQLVGGVQRRLDAGEELDKIMGDFPRGTFSGEELDELIEYAGIGMAQ